MDKFYKYLNESRFSADDFDPQNLFATIPTELVAKVATGKVDAKEWAKQQMVNRGLDKRGKWIGHDKAEKLWKPKVKPIK